MANPVEVWKAEKHGFDVWPDVLRYAAAATPMQEIETADLERMKWHGLYYRKRDGEGSYMLRIRLTGCELNADQADVIAAIAREDGYGIVDVTTRANLQVQGLAIADVPPVLEKLEQCGLTAKQTGHDNIRNVFCHPFTGVDPDELIDTRPLCAAVTELFMDSRIYSDLPRKFNIAIDGRAEHGGHYWSQDLSFLAKDTQHGVHFQVLIGGTQGQNPRLAWHLPALVHPEQVVAVTQALLDLFREQGSREKRDRARFRYLIETLGIPAILAHVEQHVAQQLGSTLLPDDAPPAAPEGYEDLVGWFPQSQAGLWIMGLSVPLGRLTWQQLEGVAQVARKFGDGALRASVDQGLAILNIPAHLKDRAANAISRYVLSPYADTLDRNTVACTGKQFCNIAVTDTKGHMLQLVTKLRERKVTLQGLRMHMSGCPSSCAQHHTVDIGLKGVRVRRRAGTTEGFDVYLGGGVGGEVQLGLIYKLGVDMEQLPLLLEEVIREYREQPDLELSFSTYWRNKLGEQTAAKVGDDDYVRTVWQCEDCEYAHRGEDPPVSCPRCAALRRRFVRLDPNEVSVADSKATTATVTQNNPAPIGFTFVAEELQLTDTAGLAVEVGGKELALYRIDGVVHAIDNACPHEGAPLTQGEFANGVVTCPWHGWTFAACSGCSLSPAGHDLTRHETRVEQGKIYVRQPAVTTVVESAPPSESPMRTTVAESHKLMVAKAPAPMTATLKIWEIIDETPDTKTFRLDNFSGHIPAHRAGQFVKVCLPIDGRDEWSSFTISSSPHNRTVLDLTIKRNPEGRVSNFMHDCLRPGDSLTIKGPQGGFFFDPAKHAEPLALISAGSGVTPMYSIAEYLSATGDARPCLFLQGARTSDDVIFAAALRRLTRVRPHLRYHVALSQPTSIWTGGRGRIDMPLLHKLLPDPQSHRFFLCGPNAFMDALQSGLEAVGVPSDRIHTEAFQKLPAALPAGLERRQEATEERAAALV